MSADGILTVSVVGWDIDPKFLARVQITSLPAAQPVGMGRWRIVIGPTVTRVEINLTVRNADLSKPLESLEQVFGVETSNNIRTLRPASCSNHGDGWSPGSPTAATDPTWQNRLHPRLHWSADSAHEFPGLAIDFTFVVVTAYLKGIASLSLANEYDRDADPNDPHHGCQLHALEFTNKIGPRTWFVCVPPSLDTSLTNVLRQENWKRGMPKERAQSSVDALVYLRSRVTKNDKLHTYTKIEETQIAGWMNRFFAEPPRQAPFFAQPKTDWNSFPNIGFERQLVRSGKSLLLIKPWPSGLDYGSLLGSGTLRPILNHLMICLAGNGLVAKDSLSGPRCGRIGLAGFSGGGNEAIKVWRGNRGQIDELYLFDPQSFRLDQNNPKNSVWLFFDANGKIAGDLLEWFRDDNKHLRLIGGLKHADALLIADNLLPKWRSLLEDYEAGRGNKPPRVWVKPSTFAYRTGIGDGETYAYAMLFNSKSPGALLDLSQCRLTPPGSPASALTQATGLEWIQDPKDPLVTKVNIKVLGRVETLDCSHAELAGFLHTLWLPQISGRSPANLWKKRESLTSAYISDSKIFESVKLLLAWYIMYGQTKKPFDDDHAKGEVQHRAYSVRHQWTTPGGENDGTRGDKFIGHWEMCLRHSRFRSL